MRRGAVPVLGLHVAPAAPARATSTAQWACAPVARGS